MTVSFVQISGLQSSDITESECSWVEKFPIGSLIKGTIQEQNDLGVVVNFDNINNVLGFIPQYHSKSFWRIYF